MIDFLTAHKKFYLGGMFWIAASKLQSKTFCPKKNSLQIPGNTPGITPDNIHNSGGDTGGITGGDTGGNIGGDTGGNTGVMRPGVLPTDITGPRFFFLILKIHYMAPV